MAKTKVLTEDVTPEDMKKAKDNACPWCNFEGVSELSGEHHTKESSKVVNTLDGTMQCMTCGKNWNQIDLGKPWSIALERGEVWAREHKGRLLQGL